MLGGQRGLRYPNNLTPTFGLLVLAVDWGAWFSALPWGAFSICRLISLSWSFFTAWRLDSRRRKAEAASLLRAKLGAGTESLLPHSFGSSTLQGQPRFKRRENRAFSFLTAGLAHVSRDGKMCRQPLLVGIYPKGSMNLACDLPSQRGSFNLTSTEILSLNKTMN